jgi:hypothetical protein
MYACTYETEGSFSRWCVLSMIRAALLLTHIPPCHSWVASCQYSLYLSRFLPITTVNVYSLLQYLVLGNKLQGGETSHPPLP